MQKREEIQIITGSSTLLPIDQAQLKPVDRGWQPTLWV